MAAGRWLKRIGIALVALVALLFVAVVAALMLVDTDALKGVIAERVEDATGRALRIEGPLDVSVFPWLGFELGATRLANAQGFGDAPFATLERAELRVRLLPLLRREVSLDTVVLHGLEVNLARNAQGTTNWAELAGEEAAAAPETEAPADRAEPTGEGLGGVSLRVAGVEIADARVGWRDATTGQVFTLRDLDLETGALEADTPTPVRLSLAFQPEGGPTVDLGARASLRFDPGARTAELAGVTLDVGAAGDAVPGGALEASLGGDIRVDARAGRATIEPLELTLAGRVTATGRVDARFDGDVPRFEGDLAVAAFSPRALMRALDIRPPDTADGDVLQEAELALAFRGTPTRLQVDGIEGRLDATRLSGDLRAELDAVPSAVFDLEVDAIDVDRYLPAGSAPPVAAATGGGDGDGADPIAALPLEALRGADVEGRAGIGRLGYRGLDMTDVRLEFRLAGGLLTLERADLAVAGGTVRNRGRFDARGDTPALRLETNVAGVHAEPLLGALAGSAPIVGRLDTTLALDTAGGTLDAWLGALDGRLATTFADGAIAGINLAQTLRVAAARLRGDAADEAAATRSTDFSILRFAGEIRDGVLHANELDLRAPLLRAQGDGRLDLGRGEVDYTARVTLTGTLEGQGGAAAADLRGLEIPVRFRGPWSDPSIDVQLAKALKEREAAKIRAKKEAAEAEAERDAEQARQRLEQKRREAEEGAKEKLKDKLEGLFE